MTYEDFTGQASEAIQREELDQYDYVSIPVFDGCFGLIQDDTEQSAA